MKRHGLPDHRIGMAAPADVGRVAHAEAGGRYSGIPPGGGGVGAGVLTPEIGTGVGQAGEDGGGHLDAGRGGPNRRGRCLWPSRVRIDTKNLPWENWNDIYNEVIDPLAQEGADVRCDVVIVAKGDAAIRENTIELGIKESLGQRGIQADIQTG